MRLTRTWPALACVIALAGCNQSSTQTSTTGTTTTTTTQVTPPGGTSAGSTAAAGGGAQAGTAPAAQEVTMPSGLKYQDIKVGDGAVAEQGMLATVDYTGWLTDGTKFDSSKDRGQTFDFKLGAGQVIRGWDEGVKGMRVGGVRKLTIPPELGYGAQGAGGVIPPNATLVFEVELHGVK
jgi:FKBP-type peptidyl-prolyl cis-trans isomerase FkpA